jgi:hypothetical protein
VGEARKNTEIYIPPPGQENVSDSEEVVTGIIKQCFLEVSKQGKPPRNDYIALGFSRAIGGLLADVRREEAIYVQQVFKRGIDYRIMEGKDVKASQIKGLALRIFQDLLLHEFSYLDYPPDKFNSSQGVEAERYWQGLIIEILKNPEGLKSFMRHISEHDVTTNIYKRAIPIHFALLPYQEQLREQSEDGKGRPLRLLEIGTSRMHILKAMSMDIPLGDNFIIREFMPDPNVPHVIADDGGLTEGARHMLNRRLNLGKCVGVDKVPLNNEQAKRWAFSDSHYPIDLHNPGVVETYRRIDREQVENVSFEQLNPAQMALPAHHHDAYDAVIFPTMWHQVHPLQRPKPEIYFQFTDSRCEEGRPVGIFGQVLVNSMSAAQSSTFRVRRWRRGGRKSA